MSGKAYLKALPDTRVTHDDKLTHGENFSNKPGEMAVLHYRVKFTTPGRYYVWVRAYSSGPEDNNILRSAFRRGDGTRADLVLDFCGDSRR